MFLYYFKLSWLSIKRTPMLSLLMVLAIGLGIGVSMTVLTVNYLMGQDPIPSKSSELYAVQLFSYGPGHENSNTVDNYAPQITYQDAMNIHESPVPLHKTRSVVTGATVIPATPDVNPWGEAIRAIDSDFFTMFKVPFLFGKAWDVSVDSAPENVVVIGKEINDKLFKGENSVGREINLDSIIYTIVGVVDDWNPSPRFYDLNNGKFTDSEVIYAPFSLVPVHDYVSWGNNWGWKTEEITSEEEKRRSEIFWNQYWVELPDSDSVEGYENW